MPAAATTNVTRVCGTCGSKLFGDAPQGLCSLCLFNAALAPLLDEAVAAGDDGGSKDPAKIPSEFGDYEFLEEVGRGGQGVVYRARQKSLNRTVALKVIALGSWATETHLKRFRREAEAAASLEHPNIVPIHEVGERDGQCYFSMKFIEGGQLDEVISQTPMPIRQAAELVAKVARTVHYAHEHGILHRDIKPGNILLDANGDPHLTDFGLARLLDTKSSVTRTIDVLGTPSYMAPEQAAGETAKLGKATDVYGLGAVLCQLLTGQPPFAGGTTYETIRLLRDTEPRQPRLLNPKVDRDLSTICLKCLEKDPKRRYPSALALAEDLEHWLRHEPIVARHTGIFTRGRKWVRRNPSSALFAAALIALASVIGWNVWKSESILPPITNGIAVLPFENLSRDPDNAYFAEGIQDEILTRLASIADLKVISRASTQHYQNKPRNLAEIATQLGVANILEGNVQKAADQVRVNVQLINAQTDSHLWADTYDRKVTDIFGVESEIAKRIAESLQAKLSPAQANALAIIPTRDAEAYDLFLKGEYQEREAESTYKGETYDRAATFYRQALARDPNFALAYARLAYNRLHRHWYIGRLTSAQLEEVRSNVEHALAIAPDLPEAHLAMGIFHYWGRHDFDTALREFNRAIELQPNNSDTIYFRAAIYRRRGEWRRALKEFERAMELDPRAAWMSDAIGSTYLLLRRWSEAEHWFKHALALDPHHLGISYRLSQTYIGSTGDIQRARQAYEGVPNERSAITVGAYEIVISEMIDNRVYLDVLERHFSDALKKWDSAPDNTVEGRLTQLKARIGIQVLAGQNAAAKQECEEARVLLESQVAQRRSEESTSFSELAWIYVCLGRNADALRVAREAAESVPIEKDVVLGPNFLVGLAQIEAHTGQSEEAVKLLRKLLTVPAGDFISVAHLKIDPVWDPIRNNPDFQKLLSGPVPETVYK
jgi:serine/threonine protein kinase/Flp pilus assembly protein TadD